MEFHPPDRVSRTALELRFNPPSLQGIGTACPTHLPGYTGRRICKYPRLAARTCANGKVSLLDPTAAIFRSTALAATTPKRRRRRRRRGGRERTGRRRFAAACVNEINVEDTVP